METPHAATPAGRPRARSLGVPFGGTPGRWNAITDVPGLEAGYATLMAGEPLGALLAGDNPMAEHFAMPAGRARSSRSWPPTRRCSRTSARRWPAG